jgi:parvulin-like peptidyl-prolyl isomerase
MRHQTTGLQLMIGVYLAAALTASWCAAQDVPGGYGNMPMAPVTPSNPGSFNEPVTRLPPTQPPATMRPPSWPGSDMGVAPQSPLPGGLPPGEMKACNGARIVAYVGSEVILESDLILRKMDKKGAFEVIGSVDFVLNQYQGQYPQEQIEAQREALIARLLPEVVQIKLIFLDAKHTLPSDRWPEIEKQLAKGFDDMQLEKMMKQFGVSSPRELDPKLRAVGTSVDREKRNFIEFILARQWQGEQIKRNEEITWDQMVGYYRRHQDEFTRPARAKCEELMVRFSKHPTEAAAGEAIMRLGNRVLAGEPFDQVARTGSDGVEAPKGGRRDWISKGSLCPELDKALFTQPIGQLSPAIIRGPTGFHIVRVTEREDAAVTPFTEAQVGIREKIVKERSAKQLHEYFTKLQERTPVKTIFDGPQVARRPDQPDESQLRR